jgi:hypothetical protein
VSALLGVLPASETYRNPYLSSCSLHLDVEAPSWGYEGFPRRIYITTGDGEVSYDQHLTLAHRLAAGTRRTRPIYVGDRLSADADAQALAARANYPRPRRSSIPGPVLPRHAPKHEQVRAPPGAQQVEGEAVTDGKREEGAGGEEREVWLDECRDAVHDYLLCE